MFPEIFSFGPIALHTYGFMMMAAFATGIFSIIHRAKKSGIDSGVMWDLSLVILFSSLIGSRLLYVITHIEEFRGNWFAIVNPVQPDGRIGIAGMVLLGGVVTATIAAIIFLKRRKLDVWQFADIVAPALALSMGIGRLGCFANGCCFGNPTDSFLGVVFPPDSPAGSHFYGIAVIPTQLISFCWGIAFFVILLYLDRIKKFNGFTFSLFLIGYSIFRILIDTIRYYDEADILIHTESLRITVSQSISAGMILFGVILFFRLKGRMIK